MAGILIDILFVIILFILFYLFILFIILFISINCSYRLYFDDR